MREPLNDRAAAGMQENPDTQPTLTFKVRKCLHRFLGNPPHQTKIANALKKYINDIEMTANNHQVSYHKSSRDSHRGNRSASNKKSRKQTGASTNMAGVSNRASSSSALLKEDFYHQGSKRGDNNSSIGSAKKVTASAINPSQ